MNGTNSSATQKLCSHLTRFWADHGLIGSKQGLRSDRHQSASGTGEIHGVLASSTAENWGPTLRRTSALVTEWSQNWGHSAKLSY
jgi:hypothetical protein